MYRNVACLLFLFFMYIITRRIELVAADVKVKVKVVLVAVE